MTDEWTDFDCNPWTPQDAEKALRWVLRQLHDTQQVLAANRDAEVAAKHVWEKRKRQAWFKDACPKPSRATGYTVADREAFVDMEAEAEKEQYEIAQAMTQAAQEHLRTLRDQSMVIAALSKTVGQVVGGGVR